MNECILETTNGSKFQIIEGERLALFDCNTKVFCVIYDYAEKGSLSKCYRNPKGKFESVT